MKFIDSHAHINDPAFDKDREQVITAFLAAGVERIAEIGCEKQEWQPALSLCEKYPQFWAVLGLHPIFAHTFDNKTLSEIKPYFTNPFVRAVGEIGLDYAYENESPREKQKEVFYAMLGLAKEVKKPVVLHCRKTNLPEDFSAYDDLAAILKNYDGGGIMHCFSGRWQDAVFALDKGFLIGINGIIGYKKNDDLRASVKKIGLERIVVETDCPYLPPQSKRGQRNSPVNIPEIAQTLADILGKKIEDVAEITSRNALKFFGK